VAVANGVDLRQGCPHLRFEFVHFREYLGGLSGLGLACSRSKRPHPLLVPACLLKEIGEAAIVALMCLFGYVVDLLLPPCVFPPFAEY
jgi:hypothetical protein